MSSGSTLCQVFELRVLCHESRCLSIDFTTSRNGCLFWPQCRTQYTNSRLPRSIHSVLLPYHVRTLLLLQIHPEHYSGLPWFVMVSPLGVLAHFLYVCGRHTASHPRLLASTAVGLWTALFVRPKTAYLAASHDRWSCRYLPPVTCCVAITGVPVVCVRCWLVLSQSWFWHWLVGFQTMQLDGKRRVTVRDEKCFACVTNNNVHVTEAPFTFSCAAWNRCIPDNVPAVES